MTRPVSLGPAIQADEGRFERQKPVGPKPRIARPRDIPPPRGPPLSLEVETASMGGGDSCHPSWNQ